MKINKFDIVKIVGVYIAMIIGAGFASGQELLQFFIRYGFAGLFGIILSSLIFGVIGYSVMSICLENKYETSDKFMEGIFGKKFGIIIEIVIAFLFLTFYFTMVAASGAAFKQVFNFPFLVGVLLITVASFVTLMTDLEGLLKLNAFLAPLMFFGGIATGIFILMSQNVATFLNDSIIINAVKENWILSAIIYASYNIVTAISVLASMKNVVKNKKTAFAGAFVSSIVLIILGLVLALPLLNDISFSKQFELPILALVYKYGPIMEYVYLIVLLLAIFSTAIGNAFAFVIFIKNKLKINPIVLKIALCISGIFISHIGFSNFVGKIYPIFGVVGFIEIVAILYVFTKQKIKKRR